MYEELVALAVALARTCERMSFCSRYSKRLF